MNDQESRDDGFREYADALERLVPPSDDADERERTAQFLLEHIETLYARAGVSLPAWVTALQAERK